ncbi:ABC transporter permease [Fodinisporobacter ferrooxydans]|uniref:Autoinducer 2 import system permease protein LsrD n=1 Tax=Fodinisporobacter ferrooxydans TaxID=2901836 RepID=A0ABY4CP85_9BACL|nr:ABC transporter permease [Alicyclobacillaceae bacterium MYW30-H2]
MQSQTQIEVKNQHEEPIKFSGFQKWKSRYKLYIPSLSASILLLILGQILSPGFASLSNIGNILSMATVLAIATIGQTIIIISGKEGIDLSVGAMMSMGALLGAEFSQGMNDKIWLAILVLVVIGSVFGFINAAAIQWLDIPPLVMTLGMTSVVNGFALAYTKGQPTGGAPSLLIQLGTGHLASIPLMVILGMILIVIVEVLLRKTRYGRNLYLSGSNHKAALIAGIQVNKTVFLTYIIAGIAGTLGGLILLGFTGTAQLEMGKDYSLLSIAAVVIGGTALTGGEGKFSGSALGSIVLVLLTSVLIALKMPAGIRELIQGVILLLILMMYSRAPKLRQ